MNISKILVATGRGNEVRKIVRNQDEAYMEVWKLWAWKCTWSSGSCSCREKPKETVKSQRESKNYVQFIKHINLI